jgi:hypothetical protein
MRGPEEKEELGTLADAKRTVDAFKKKVVEDMSTVKELEEAEEGDLALAEIKIIMDDMATMRELEKTKKEELVLAEIQSSMDKMAGLR